ncbi:unnamed protein product [Cutaneotrichosporon oleaginosum]
MLQLPASPQWHAAPPSGWKTRKVVLLFIALIAIASLILLSQNDVTTAVSNVSVTTSSIFKTDSCKGWDPHAAEELDPPECFRAQQFRQIAQFTATPEYAALKDVGQLRAINRITNCALGVTACPERPLIVSDYEFIYNPEHKAGVAHGEEVWVSSLVEGIRQMGYEMLIFNKDENRTWNYTRLLDKSIHMYFTDANHAFRCFHNPHCVRPEDYVRPATHAIEEPPAALRGVLPAWRIFGLSFWGARPNKYNAIFLDTAKHWGINGDDGHEEWSHHVLGTKWQIVPFAYPGHTDIPMTIEQACLQTPVVPLHEREDGILILGKHAPYLRGGIIKGIHPAWDDIVRAMKREGVDFWLTAKPDPKMPFPEGMVSLGWQAPAEYRRKAGSAKAMLGIGMPSISPSPYEALCAGVPVVLPKNGNHSASGWEMFEPTWFQHGPLQALGTPYVYSYDGSDPQDLVEQLTKAVNTPIEPFIPPDMTTKAVFARVKEVIEHDWEAEYHAVRAANGGRNPGYKPIQWEKCWERGVCDPAVLSHRP